MKPRNGSLDIKDHTQLEALCIPSRFKDGTIIGLSGIHSMIGQPSMMTLRRLAQVLVLGVSMECITGAASTLIETKMCTFSKLMLPHMTYQLLTPT